MALTEARILECQGHDDLLELLSAELQTRLPDGEGNDLDRFLATTRMLPIGLRAMAATYQLDVSITLDDFGSHFAHWHHRAYCEETGWALREIEAFEEAELFARAYEIVQPYWDKIGELVDDDFDDFVEWYYRSPLDLALEPLTERMWELQKIHHNLFGHWTDYARKYPHKVAQLAS
jgi:hypothetical protein